VRRVPHKLHLRTSVWAGRLSAVLRDPDQGEIGCSLKEKFLFTAHDGKSVVYWSDDGNC